VLARLGERHRPGRSARPGRRPGDGQRVPTPAVDERLAPLLDILPVQRMALALALTRGLDPDAPRGLHKVTATL
jgi:glucosamine--fructose-6-phosphate aminotransferase (isomerizing)